MKVQYIKQALAKDFVRAHHRHHSVPSTGAIFTLGLYDDEGTLRGVAMCGRPVARAYDSGLKEGHKILEITRLCTDGCENACSLLYSRCVEVARALGGFDSVITYTQTDEPGASLEATSLFVCEGICGSADWTGSRSRNVKNGVRKLRWRCSLTDKPKICKNPELALARKQKSALTWLNVVRHKLDQEVDDIYFTGNAGHDGLVCLFPWPSQGQEGEINERLSASGLPLIEFTATMDEVMELVPKASCLDFFFTEEDMHGNYDACMELCDQLMKDITDYLIRFDIAFGTDFKAGLPKSA